MNIDALASLKVFALESSFITPTLNWFVDWLNRYDKPRGEGTGYLSPPRRLSRSAFGKADFDMAKG